MSVGTTEYKVCSTFVGKAGVELVLEEECNEFRVAAYSMIGSRAVGSLTIMEGQSPEDVVEIALAMIETATKFVEDPEDLKTDIIKKVRAIKY